MKNTTIAHITSTFPITAEALRSDPRFHRRRSIIREFSLNTSTHGIPGLARSRSIPNRLFWGISFVTYTAIMIYFIVVSMKAYFAYPTQTSVNIIVNRSQPFPAVSICNYSPVRYDRFIAPFLNYTNSRNLTNTTDASTFTKEESYYIRDFFQYVINNDEPIDQFLFTLDTMLLYCEYNGRGCNSSDFIPFLSSTYGRCYTFNAKLKFNQSRVRFTTEYGGIGALTLRLYAHSHQYVPYVSGDVSAGMVAMIHDNTELPLIELAGIELATGRKHKLAYKKETRQSLPSPYSDCTNKIPVTMQAMFNQYAGADYAYSPVICYSLCVQAYVYQECHCVDPTQWTARSVLVPGTNQVVEAPLCNISDQCYPNAQNEIVSTDSIWNQFCSDCSDACTSTAFIITPSGASAPSISQINTTKLFVDQSGIPTPNDWNQTWSTTIKQNYVAVDVVCETKIVDTYVDSPSTSGVDLLSNIGGLTGLWIGISFLSLMEVVEMLYRLIRYHFLVLRNKHREAAEETSNP